MVPIHRRLQRLFFQMLNLKNWGLDDTSVFRGIACLAPPMTRKELATYHTYSNKRQSGLHFFALCCMWCVSRGYSLHPSLAAFCCNWYYWYIKVEKCMLRIGVYCASPFWWNESHWVTTIGDTSTWVLRNRFFVPSARTMTMSCNEHEQVVS